MLPLDRPLCQLHVRLARRSAGERLREAFQALRARARLRTRWREWRRGKRREGILGAPSRFSAGAWVRILEPERVSATLNSRGSLGGLLWMEQQWPYCGSVHRVMKPVRRMMDDRMRMRPISQTVLLDTVPCTGRDGTQGCGRECPMMFRDDWLEEVPPPAEAEPAAAGSARWATVRSVEEIEATLDAGRTRGGLLFMSEMFAHAGGRFRVRRKVERVFERGRYLEASEPVYILEGLHCTGAALAEDGPCDRGCRLLWHEDWLRME